MENQLQDTPVIQNHEIRHGAPTYSVEAPGTQISPRQSKVSQVCGSEAFDDVLRDPWRPATWLCQKKMGIADMAIFCGMMYQRIWGYPSSGIRY